MSSEEHVVSGKDEFTVSHLVAALKQCQSLVHPKVDDALGSESNTAVATEADWKKFWAAINTINAPVTFLIEAPEHDIAQARIAAGTVIAAIGLAITIAQTLWNIFSGWDDKAGRSQWTQDLVRDAFNMDRNFNYVIVCTNHSTNFDGVRDRDWSVRTYDYRLRIGRIRYTLYAFRSGVFSLRGDGGFLNWAFIGRVVSQDPDSRRPRNVVFRNV